MWRSIRFKTIIGFGTAVIISIIFAKVFWRTKKQYTIMRTMDMIKEFKKQAVRIRNPQRVEEKLGRIVRDGCNKLQVIVDFDFTLSRYHQNGVKCQTCHGALGSSKLMTEQFKEQSQLLYNFYNPIELDHEISLADKAPFMLEWWEKSHDVFAQSSVKKSDIESTIRESKVLLRDGVDWFLDTLHKQGVPVLILSAGLGDFLQETIRQQATLHNNITTVANFMEFDAAGESIGFKGPVIHCCNKNAGALGPHFGYFGKIPERTNAILLGDSLGDLTMDDGMAQPSVVLKIGFLNENTDESLAKYMEGYDIVLVDDQSMELVNGLIRKMI